MLRSIRVIVSLILAASAVAAQGGGRTFGKTPQADYGAVRASGVKLTTGDVEDMNPVRLLIDRRRDLKLSDDQQKQLRSMVDQLKEANRATFKSLDSLRSESRPRIDGDAEIEQVRTSVAREQMRSLVQTTRGTYDAALRGALAVLDAAQRAKAEGLLRKLAEESDQTLLEKLGGGGRGGAGGGRRGPPPQ